MYIQTSFTLTQKDREFLQQLAQKNDRSVSAELRQILKREREKAAKEQEQTN